MDQGAGELVFETIPQILKHNLYFLHFAESRDGTCNFFFFFPQGFSVEGYENIQEIKSKRIYLCQFLTALSIVRKGGHFVCKLFDVFTPFSAGVIFLMSRCFKRICIHKPNTSLPANSERYIICKWRHNDESDISPVRDYLMAVNEEFDKYGEGSEETISEIVPLKILKEHDSVFFDYLSNSNNVLGKRQINSLAKILHFSDDETLVEEKQLQLKKECMEAWKVKIKARTGHLCMEPDCFALDLLKKEAWCIQNSPENISTIQQLEKCMVTIHDWRVVISGADAKTGTQATFFLGTSHRKCFKFDQNKRRWTDVEEPNFEVSLTPGTFLFGEIVPEVVGEGLSQMTTKVLHIIDAHTLGGEDISHLHYTDRMRRCELYTRALDRPTMNNIMAIRAKESYELDELELNSLLPMRLINMKNGSQDLAVQLRKSRFYLPKGMMFLKTTKLPFMRFCSQQHGVKYYWAPNFESKFDKHRPREASAAFKYTSLWLQTWFMNEEVDCRYFREERFVTQLLRYIWHKQYCH